MALVFLGIGSNLGDRINHCEQAVAMLKGHAAIAIAARSPWKEYPALTLHPGEVQPPYCNGVVQLTTTLDPAALFAVCHQIERELGRERRADERWAPRTIDIDILFYDDLVINTPTLTIPHPELAKRMFVLEPLAMLAPDYVHPVLGQTIRSLYAILSR